MLHVSHVSAEEAGRCYAAIPCSPWCASTVIAVLNSANYNVCCLALTSAQQCNLMVSAVGGDARLQGAPRPPPGRQPRPRHPAPVQPAAGAGAAQPPDRLSGAAKIVGSLVNRASNECSRRSHNHREGPY